MAYLDPATHLKACQAAQTTDIGSPNQNPFTQMSLNGE